MLKVLVLMTSMMYIPSQLIPPQAQFEIVSEIVFIIIDIRDGAEFGNKSPTLNTLLYGPEYDPAPVRKPVVDLDATSVLHLIPRKDFKMEPIFTADLCRSKLYEIVFEKLILPQREGFTQNVERLIRRTTEAYAIY